LQTNQFGLKYPDLRALLAVNQKEDFNHDFSPDFSSVFKILFLLAENLS